ncbi:PREDICTED: THAP domain-containing protein 1-like [Cyprinodon variegatus]|uniref:THAP domain-containing protein 1-like n=1 Tax=Cyprinodon variegatus TaxID=28743 RepID=UPI000742A650|nr:PREDICTED: THAP domain-containing protein 1-like [Cyprinodon variegatus]
MGRYKCAYNCEDSTDPDIKFFKFPIYNPKKLKKWLSNMKLKDWTPTRFSALCINHFEEQYIDRSGKCVTLRDDAVPTIFLPHDKTEKNKTSASPGRKRLKPLGPKTSEKDSASSSTSPSEATNNSINKELDQKEEEQTGLFSLDGITLAEGR